ncbi:MAG: molybdenum cofactor biosysynthesis protein [Candidatus Solibacter sp.]
MTGEWIEVLHLYISPGHNFFGHHGQPPGEEPIIEVASVECVAGRGLRGDRFLDYKDDYKGQITFFAWEVYDDLCNQLNIRDKHTGVLRRNVITRGIDLNTLVGREFAVQGIRFQGMAECNPCYWMNTAFGPGAEDAMAGRGGLRARILTSGVLGSVQRP